MKEEVFKIKYLKDKTVSNSGTTSPIVKLIDVSQLPASTLNMDSATAVPNTGYIDKIYFNKTLSNAEMTEIFSQLEYTHKSYAVENDTYTILADENGDDLLRAEWQLDDIGEKSYALYYVPEDFYIWGGEWHNADGNISPAEWYLPEDYLEIGQNVAVVPRGTPVGTAIPKTGTIDKIYFNMQSDFKALDAAAIFDTLEYSYHPQNPTLGRAYIAVVDDGYGGITDLCVTKEMTDNGPMFTVLLDNRSLLFINVTNINEYSTLDWDYYKFSGSTTEDGIYMGYKNFSGSTLRSTYTYTYGGVDMEFTVGDQNEKIAALMAISPFNTFPSLSGQQNELLSMVTSSTPYEFNFNVDQDAIYRLTEDKEVSYGEPTGTVLPNSGVIEKIFFNWHISGPKAIQIFESLEYTYSENNPGVGTYYAYAGDASGSLLAYFFEKDTSNVNNTIYRLKHDYGNLFTISAQSPDLQYSQWNYYSLNTWNLDNAPSVGYKPAHDYTCMSTYTDYNGTTFAVGNQNDKITSLISFGPDFYIAPKQTISTQSLWCFNDDWIKMKPNNYEVPHWKGTAVPVGQYIDTIYFNTNLEIQEVQNMLNMLPSFYSSVFVNNETQQSISVVNDFRDGRYIEYSNYENNNQILIWCDDLYASNKSISRSGWQGVSQIQVNSLGEPFDSWLYASPLESNHILFSLVSVTPFELTSYTIENPTIYNAVSIGDDIWKYNNEWVNTSTVGRGKYFYNNIYNAWPLNPLIKVLPEGTEILGASAFDGLAFETVILPSTVKYIGFNAFCYSEIKYINLPESLEFIGSGAFSECSRLQTISIPDKVTQILPFTFNWSTQLRFVFLPANLASIGEEAFAGCESLQWVDMTRMNHVPILEDVSAFEEIPSNCVFYVKESLLEEFKNATNWSAFANRFIGE